jgi:hypothetical protein
MEWLLDWPDRIKISLDLRIARLSPGRAFPWILFSRDDGVPVSAGDLLFHPSRIPGKKRYPISSIGTGSG